MDVFDKVKFYSPAVRDFFSTLRWVFLDFILPVLNFFCFHTKINTYSKTPRQIPTSTEFGTLTVLYASTLAEHSPLVACVVEPAYFLAVIAVEILPLYCGAVKTWGGGGVHVWLDLWLSISLAFRIERMG